MTPPHPSTTLPLVFDEPRKAKKPPRHLADLTSAERKAAVEEAGLPGFRAKQVSHHYFTPARASARGHDRPADGPARAAGRGAAADPDHAGARDADRQRHHTQDLVAAARRRAGRVGADALPGPGDDVCVIAGRLRDGVPVLRDRSRWAATQHEHGRDHRAGGGGCAFAGRRRGTGRAGPGLQRRVHGDGRADGQLQGRDRFGTPDDRPDSRRPRHVGAWHHGVDRRARTADAAARRGRHPGHARAVSACA